jgi:DNA-binding response OmpR family regulator
MHIGKPKIMVVDDDKEYTNLYQEFLKLAGFDPIVENRSTNAMALAQSTMPDLFILDLMMPEIDGFKLCRMLRTDRRFRGTPIIIVTALNDTDSRLVAIGAGANAYFTKPFYLEDLKCKINSLLEINP